MRLPNSGARLPPTAVACGMHGAVTSGALRENWKYSDAIELQLDISLSTKRKAVLEISAVCTFGVSRQALSVLRPLGLPSRGSIFGHPACLSASCGKKPIWAF